MAFLLLLVIGLVVVVPAIIVLLVLLFDAPNRRQARLNRRSPAQTRPAMVVDKRTHMSGSAGTTGTSYFVTFELEDHTRLEFPVYGAVSGQLAVGDRGSLSWQGSWYRGFTREILR